MLARLIPDWFPYWEGECAAVIGAGPSANKAGVEKLKDRIHVIAVNESYKLCPWAEILYCCDAKWWVLRHGARDFHGLKITQDHKRSLFPYPDACSIYPEIKTITIKRNGKKDYAHELVTDELGTIGSGGNGGFQAVNLLVQFGIKAIALVGLDMGPIGNEVHWHGRHPDPLSNPYETNFKTWISCFTKVAPRLKELGVDVVNCSPKSALQCFPKMSVDDALKRWSL